MKIPAGPNPALGIRSARFSLHRPDILKRQLRALYRASAAGPLRCMFPLVSGVRELARLRQVCDEVRAELGDEKVAHDPATPLGVMIETPSAALTADHLARHCDFLSVGTNDLIQYAFAADRENDDVAHLHQPLHAAVLRTLKSLVDMARAAGAPISICGDMAGDPFLTWILIGLGFRELSMDRDRIPLVKAVVRGSSVAEAEALVRRPSPWKTKVESGELLRSKLEDRFPIRARRLHPFGPRQLRSRSRPWYTPGVAFPPRPEPFRGRAAELGTLAAACRPGSNPRLALVGTGGSGKSTLAAALGHRVSARYRGGIEWFRVGRWDHRTLLDMLAIRMKVPARRDARARSAPARAAPRDRAPGPDVHRARQPRRRPRDGPPAERCSTACPSAG